MLYGLSDGGSTDQIKKLIDAENVLMKERFAVVQKSRESIPEAKTPAEINEIKIVMNIQRDKIMPLLRQIIKLCDFGLQSTKKHNRQVELRLRRLEALFNLTSNFSDEATSFRENIKKIKSECNYVINEVKNPRYVDAAKKYLSAVNMLEQKMQQRQKMQAIPNNRP